MTGWYEAYGITKPYYSDKRSQGGIKFLPWYPSNKVAGEVSGEIT